MRGINSRFRLCVVAVAASFLSATPSQAESASIWHFADLWSAGSKSEAVALLAPPISAELGLKNPIHRDLTSSDFMNMVGACSILNVARLPNGAEAYSVMWECPVTSEGNAYTATINSGEKLRISDLRNLLMMGPS